MVKGDISTRSSAPVKGYSREPDMIVAGGVVISMVDGQPPIPNGAVFVSDGVITEIREGGVPRESERGETEVISVADGIVMPGLVNSHTHLAMTLFRGFADDLPLKEWLFEKIFPAEAAHLNPDTVFWGALLGCLEMIASGTTTCIEGYFFQDATVRAVHEAGLRALVAQGVIDLPAPGISNPKDNLRVARQFVEKWQGVSDRITPGIFCHSPLTCSERTLKEAWAISRDNGLPMQIHLSETGEEVAEVVKRSGKRPVQFLDNLGLLGKGLIAAHGVHLDDGELTCLAEKGVGVVHVPESNMKLSSGAARVSKMVRMGIPVGLGTDGCSSNNNLDLFQEMDTAAKLSKVVTRDPVSLDAWMVGRMATVRGAELMDVGHRIGTLEVGKRADIIVVDAHCPHLCPMYDPMSALVYSASGADVRDVVVNGRVLMRNRSFTTLDADEIMARVRRICRGIRP
jgi:5-methylthioadenosine/S-adenosylhomocysteine deaminase